MAIEKRLIDAYSLIGRALEEKRFVFQTKDFLNEQYIIDTVYRDLGEFILSAPTVDAVEVVRCKDCVWCHKIEDLNYCENPNTPWIDDPDFDDITVADNDYCSYGERKDNEG